MQDPTHFKALLDSNYRWPAPYLFKFICDRAQLPQLSAVLGPEIEFQLRESKGGKYVSVSFTQQMPSSDAVLAIYAKAAQVPGLLAL